MQKQLCHHDHARLHANDHESGYDGSVYLSWLGSFCADEEQEILIQTLLTVVKGFSCSTGEENHGLGQ